MGRRQRAQERAKAEYEANYGKPPPPPPAPPSKWVTTVLPIVVVILGIGGGIAWYFLKERLNTSSMLSQRGDPKGSLVVGARLVLLDRVDTEDRNANDNEPNVTLSSTRVTVLDATTGKQTAKLLIDGLDGCQRATDDRMWCTVGKTLRLYGLPALNELFVVEKAASIHVVPGIWQVEKGTVTQLLSDGTAAVIDPATLKIALVSDVPRALEPDITGRRNPGTIDMYESSCDPDLLHGMSRRKSKLPKLLDPELIGDDLVVHKTSLDPSDAQLKLSRLRGDGTLAWTAELGAASCENAVRAGSTYVVTTKASDPRALVIDLESGAIKWRIP